MAQPPGSETRASCPCARAAARSPRSSRASSRRARRARSCRRCRRAVKVSAAPSAFVLPRGCRSPIVDAVIVEDALRAASRRRVAARSRAISVSSVSRLAIISGRAAFLAPEIGIAPLSSLPPTMRMRSMRMSPAGKSGPGLKRPSKPSYQSVQGTGFRRRQSPAMTGGAFGQVLPSSWSALVVSGVPGDPLPTPTSPSGRSSAPPVRRERACALRRCRLARIPPRAAPCDGPLCLPNQACRPRMPRTWSWKSPSRWQRRAKSPRWLAFANRTHPKPLQHFRSDAEIGTARKSRDHVALSWRQPGQRRMSTHAWRWRDRYGRSTPHPKAAVAQW